MITKYKKINNNKLKWTKTKENKPIGRKKTNEEKEKKIWINWVNPSNQVNPLNLGFVLWKFDN